MKKIFKMVIALLCVIQFTAVGKARAVSLTSFEVFSFVTKPTNNSINIAAVVLKVTANVASGATRYTIELNTNPDFSGTSIARTSTIDNQRTLVFNNLAYSTRYYARATTNVSSGFGKVTSFTTRAEAFSSLIDPLNAITSVDPITVRIEASYLAWAKNFTIQISTASDFATIQISHEGERVFLARNLKYSTTYYARVITDINTIYGPVTSFSTRARVPQSRLWGVTSEGGADDDGSIFSYSLDSMKFTKHYDFIIDNSFDGVDYDDEQLTGYLMPAPGGGFYGFTKTIRSSGAAGSIFYFKPGVFDFLTGTSMREGSMILGTDGFFYINYDRYFNSGEINKISLNPFQPGALIHVFGLETNGRRPVARVLELSDSFVYGTALTGGVNKGGVIYKAKNDGKVYQVIHHFNLSTTGAEPQAGLSEAHDGYLYGAAVRGGAYNMGTIFRLKPDGSEFTVLHNFNGADGQAPWSEVMIEDGVIYGTTATGGSGSSGTVFRMNTDGSGFAVMLNFYNDGISGIFPREPLISDHEDNLYGTTPAGGQNGLGIIFKIKTDGSGYEKLFDFTSDSGGRPQGPLTLTDDTFISSPGASSAKQKLVDASQSRSVGIFPNPFSDHFNIRSQSAIRNLVITDVTGRILYRAEKINGENFELGKELPAGVYFLKMMEGDKVVSRCVVKK